MSFNANQMEEKMDNEFSDIGADVGEVQKQLASLQVNKWNLYDDKKRDFGDGGGGDFGGGGGGDNDDYNDDVDNVDDNFWL